MPLVQARRLSLLACGSFPRILTMDGGGPLGSRARLWYLGENVPWSWRPNGSFSRFSKEMTSMRYLPARALLVAVALLLTVPISVQAYHGGAETVYVTPTESVLTVPTSYVVPTSYLWPTSYVSPTVYTTSYLTSTYYLSPTAYVVPTYSATGYYVPRRLGRSLVPTTRTYYPALTATAWEYPVVATSAIYPASDCSTAGIVSTPLPSSPTLKTTRNGGASERRPSG